MLTPHFFNNQLASLVREILTEGNIEQEEIERAFFRSIPTDVYHGNPKDLDDAIEKLCLPKLPPDKVNPLLEFLRRVLNRELSSDVGSYVSAIQLQQLEDKLKGERENYQCLLIHIQSQDCEYLEYWHFFDGKFSSPKKQRIEGSIEETFLSVLGEVEQYLARKLVVELFVPFEMLSQKFELWYERDKRLTANHQLHLRWSERQSELLKNRWTDLNEKIICQQNHLPPIYWVESENHPGDLECDVREKSCPYGLCFGISQVTTDPGKKHLEDLLYGGAPYILWPNMNISDLNSFKETLNKHISKINIFALPLTLHEIRMNAIRKVKGIDEQCENLVIFWDDPDRNPLNKKFRQPTGKK